MTIKLERVREITPKTAHTIARWLNSPKVVRYSEQRHRKHTTDTQISYVLFFSGDYYLITENGQLYGTLTARPDAENDSVELGVLIAPSCWGAGVATEAYRLAIAKYRRRYSHIWSGMMASNIGMQRVCLNVGMKAEGIVYGRFLLDDAPEDMIVMGKWT